MNSHRVPAVRQLRFWREAQLAALSEVLQDALVDWAGAWGVGLEPDGAVTCTRATDASFDAEQHRPLCSCGEAAAWMSTDTDLAAWLAGELFGEEAPVGSIAHEVASECGEDALLRIAAAMRMQRNPDDPLPPRWAPSPWSGWVVARLPFSCRLLVNAEAVEAALQEQATPATTHATGDRVVLSPVLSAASGVSLPVSVHLEGCEVDLGVLQGLQRGDVLRLQHRLEVPASVRSAAGETLFSGYLARKGSRKAVELVFPPVHRSQGDATP